jgi:hypothetical protein
MKPPVLLLIAVTSVLTIFPIYAGEVRVRFPDQIDPAITRGRVFLFVSRSEGNEPRLESSSSLFGVDVPAVRPGLEVVVAAATPGYPESTLGDLKAGTCRLQAVFNVYTRFDRSDGQVIWAHQDQWEGQHFAKSPGNLVSAVQRGDVGTGTTLQGTLTLDRILPPVEVPADTVWVKRFRFRSPLLSRFWGQPIYLGATVLLPKGYEEHPTERYPVIYLQGHFSLGAPYGFDPTPPPEPVPSMSWGRRRAEARANGRPVPEAPPDTPLTGPYSNTENGREFHASWTSQDFPRVMIVTFQHPTPWFDDSYGVNSPNCGPYGDAIMEELIPEIERRFRTIPESHARILTGGSTGGWGALALQIYHPTFFGGAWAFSPDPVDFRHYYGGVNLYVDTNAFVRKSTPGLEGGGASNRRWSQKARVLAVEDSSFEWWKHTPVATDGYPASPWDLETGRINHAVVEAMRANNFDLREYLARKWPEIGRHLVGKLHVYSAAVDAFYSNFAVPDLEEFMRGTSNPHDPGVFVYGPPGSRHTWQPLTHAEIVREIDRHIAAHAPAGARTDGLNRSTVP